MKNSILSLLLLSLMIVSCGRATTSKKSLTADSTPQEVVDFMLEGNKRFVEQQTLSPNREMSYVSSLEAGQNPQVAVVACSDSRVPVELLFDMGFGDVFVIRTAGNTIADNLSLGSVDYALNHLGVKVIIFLAHTSCGAITGVVGMGEHSHHHIDNDECVESMLEVIAEGIEQHRGSGGDVTQAVVDNALVQANNYTERPFVKSLIDEEKLIVVAALYELSTGEVKLIE